MLPKGEVKLIAETLKKLSIDRYVYFFACIQRRQPAECSNDSTEDYKLFAGGKNGFYFVK